MAGNNFRLTDLQAAVCVPQLAGYRAQVAARQRNAQALNEGLAGISGLVTPTALPRRHHVWHQYTLLLDNAVDRESFMASITADGIGCGIYYPRVAFDYDCYRNDPRVIADGVPVARSVAQRCVSLPVHPHLTDGEVERIVLAVQNAMRAAA